MRYGYVYVWMVKMGVMIIGLYVTMKKSNPSGIKIHAYKNGPLAPKFLERELSSNSFENVLYKFLEKNN